MYRGLQLIKQKGMVTYIEPNKFLLATMGTKIRQLLKKENLIKRLIDFGTNQIFKTATTYTCIIFISQSESETFEYKKFNLGENYLDFNSIAFSDIDFKNLPDKANWALSNNSSNSVLEKIKAQKYKFIDITEKIFKGSSTGNDKIFLLDLVSENSKTYSVKSEVSPEPFEIEKKTCRKFLYGESVLRYVEPNSTKLLLFPYKKEFDKYVLYTANDMKKTFPLAFSYLKKHKELLLSRKIPLTADKFFKFSAARSLNDYEQTKILIPDMLVSDRVSLDENGEYFTGPAIHCPVFNSVGKQFEQKFYLAILNSKLFWYFISHTSTALRGDAYRLTPEFLNDFVFPDITPAQQKPIIALVDKILAAKKANPQADTSKDEAEIDRLVYALYGLSEDEIKIVKGK